MTLRYDIPLLPYIKIREEEEEKRAAKAIKPQTRKIRKIHLRYPSVNNMYPIRNSGRGKRLSDEGRIFKEYVYDTMKALDEARYVRPLRFESFECSYIYFMTHEMLFKNDGDLRKTDVSNYLKATEDAVFEFLLEDDSNVVSIHGYKRLTMDEPKLVVLISPDEATNGIHHSDTWYSYEELTDGAVLSSAVR